MAITLRQLLKNVYHNELRCIAGEAGLDNEIHGANIVDNPEILSWLYGGELILSTGYVTKSNPRMLSTLVSDLKRKGCVGFGMKVKRYYETVPQILIDEGNKYDFPILEISYEMRMSEVVRMIYMNLFNEERSEAERIHSVYSRVTQSILSGGEIGQALYNVSLAISNPVIIADDSFNLIAYENPQENTVDLSKFFHLNSGDKILDDAQTNYLFEYYDSTKFKAHTITIDADEHRIDTTILTIELQKKLFGFLIIPQTMHPLNYTDFRVLESIVSIIGIHLLKNFLESDASKTGSNNFVSNVLLSMGLSDDMIKYYCNLHGFDYALPRICMNIEVNDFLDLPYDKRSHINSVFKQERENIFSKYELRYFYVQQKNSFIIFVFFSHNTTNRQITEISKQIAYDFHIMLSKNNIEHYIGLSSCGISCHHISQSFKESLDVISLGKYIYPGKKIYNHQDMLIYILLKNTMTTEQMHALYSSTIGGLDQYDKKNNTEFLKTLEIYINHHNNITQAAYEMHLHRNTMLYRIDKIKDILMIDLDNPDILLNLQIGIHVKKLLDAYYH